MDKTLIMVSRSKFINEIIICMHLCTSNRVALVGSSTVVKYNTTFINHCVWENTMWDAHYMYAREATNLLLSRNGILLILNILCFLTSFIISVITVTDKYEILEN